MDFGVTWVLEGLGGGDGGQRSLGLCGRFFTEGPREGGEGTGCSLEAHCFPPSGKDHSPQLYNHGSWWDVPTCPSLGGHPPS